MANILEQEDDLKGMPDSMLLIEMEQPSGRYPPFLIASEQQRRNSMRENYAASEQQPTTTIAEQEYQKGLASAMPTSSPVPVTPNSSSPPFPVGDVQQGLAGAGVQMMANTGGQFPDLSGDGKVTRKDILMGRGVMPMSEAGQFPSNATGAIQAQQQATRDLDAGLAALLRQGISAASATAQYTTDQIRALGRSISSLEDGVSLFYPDNVRFRDPDVPYSNPNSVAGDQAGILGEVLEGAGGLLVDSLPSLPEAQEFPMYEQQFRDFSGPPMTADQRESSEIYQEGLKAAQTASSIPMLVDMGDAPGSGGPLSASTLSSEDRSLEDAEIDFLNAANKEYNLSKNEEDNLEEDFYGLQRARNLVDGLIQEDDGETPQVESFTPTGNQQSIMQDIFLKSQVPESDDENFRMKGVIDVDNVDVPLSNSILTDMERMSEKSDDLYQSRSDKILELIDSSRSQSKRDAFYAAITQIGAGIAGGNMSAGINAAQKEVSDRQKAQNEKELVLETQLMAAEDKNLDREIDFIKANADIDLNYKKLSAQIQANKDLQSRNQSTRQSGVSNLVNAMFDADDYVSEQERIDAYRRMYNTFAGAYNVPLLAAPTRASTGSKNPTSPITSFDGKSS